MYTKIISIIISIMITVITGCYDNTSPNTNTDTTPVPTYRTIVSNRFDLTSYNKVVFIGNSITLHGANYKIGWTNNCGMAASDPDHDYVHIMQKYIGVNKKYIVRNMTPLERTPLVYNFSDCDDIKNFKADLIILKLSENVKDVDNFITKYVEYINYIKSENTMIIIVSGFCNRPIINDRLCEMAKANHWNFIDLSYLDKLENRATQYENPSIAAHPNDKGMEEIANTIIGYDNEIAE